MKDNAHYNQKQYANAMNGRKTRRKHHFLSLSPMTENKEENTRDTYLTIRILIRRANKPIRKMRVAATSIPIHTADF